MLRNYLITAWRNLIRNKIYATINLSGLALGLASTVIILMWIQRELRVDQFHENIDNLYIVRENQSYSSRGIFTVRATPGPMIPKMKETYPEIAHATRLTWGNQHLFQIGEQNYKEGGRYADPDFFQMFSFPFIHGNPETAIQSPQSIAISQELSEKLFGSGNSIGKSIKVVGEGEYQVTGVFKDIPDNSTLDFDFIMPLEDYIKKNSWLKNWNSNGIQAYVLLNDGITPTSFEKKIKTFVSDNSEQDNVELFLQPYGDAYLRTDYKDGTYQGGGRIRYVKLFAIIAGFILLIACINFMNLATAQSSKRAKEVGVRRASGATRDRLIMQFLSECLFLTFCAGTIAVTLVWLILPWFNQLFNVELGLGLLGAPEWFILLGLLVLTGILAGSYPAFFLSSFEPVRVLKGLVKTGGNAIWLRKGMVITQFAIATFLILSTLVIYKQMQYLRNKNLGYKKENLIYMSSDGQIDDKFTTFKQELDKVEGVESISYTNGYIYSWGNNSSGVQWPGKNPEESILFQRLHVGYDFLQTIGAELADGRDFSPAFPADTNNYIINERAAELMGMDDPVGQQITVGQTPGTIVGLTKDFHVTSLYNQQDPVLINLNLDLNIFTYMRLKGDNIAQTLDQVEAVWNEMNPGYPFEFSFVDQEYDKMYRTEARTSALSKVFGFLSIFVSCLGLFGLATFTAEQRTKEVGIRKVLGASILQLFSLLSKDFLWLVAIAFIIAIPASWYLMDKWLADFAYHIGIEWWMILIVGVVAVFIALLTVSFQTVKTALANPVKALKYE